MLAEPDRNNEIEQAELRRAQSGDRNAFARLYQRHHQRTYALCLRLMGNPAKAEDAVQEVYIRVWQKLPQFRFEAAFATWLHRLTVNLVLNELQRQPWWQKILPLEGQEEPAAPDSGLEGLDRLLPRLPTRTRQVFVLYAIEGYRHDEIATLLNIRPGTSKAQYHRAREMLKEMLS
ncbi:RNA polymerase sigma factor [Ferrimonas balearica]|uniref:RNA polymerase sigma factor n=1 Tax=Ferrimonas balearica TaxID=44012 RepID=UPI0028F74328|nr:sigma-70 family RNA polymerase sigma factor [Ferrimonas balearica]